MEKIGNYAAARALREVMEKFPGFTEYLKGQTTSNDMNDQVSDISTYESVFYLLLFMEGTCFR